MKKIFFLTIAFTLLSATTLMAQDDADTNESTPTAESTDAPAIQPDPIMSALQDNLNKLNTITRENQSAATGQQNDVPASSVNDHIQVQKEAAPQPYPVDNANYTPVRGTSEQGLYRLTPEKTDNGVKRTQHAGNGN